MRSLKLLVRRQLRRLPRLWAVLEPVRSRVNRWRAAERAGDEHIAVAGRRGLVVAVALRPCLARRLNQAWDEQQLVPGPDVEQLDVEAADLVLVETAAKGASPQWCKAVARRCQELSVPAALWVTHPAPLGADLLEAAGHFDHVLWLDPRAGTQLGAVASVVVRGRWTPPAVWPPPTRATPSGGAPVLAHRGLSNDEEAALQRDLPIGINLRRWSVGRRRRAVLRGRERPDVLLDLAPPPSPSDGTSQLIDLAASRVPVVSAGRVVPADSDGGGRSELRSSLLDEARALVLQPELRDRRAFGAWRSVVDEHSPHARAEQLLALTRMEDRVVRATVSVVVPTIRPWQLEHVLAYVGAQLHPDVELVLVTHGFSPDDTSLRRLRDEHGVEHLVVRPADSALTLGACMNLGVDASSGTYVAKMDDDNRYAPNYLADLVRHARLTGAQVVGKGAHHVHLTASGATLLRFGELENSWSRFVQGGTLLMPREVAQAVPFDDIPRAIDTRFLSAVHRHGGRIYSADRFNFVSVRSLGTEHTWSASDYHLLSRSSRLIYFGDPGVHVTA